MSEELKSGFKFISQYVKDLSFENPNVPRKLPHMMVKPDINVSVNVNAVTLDKKNSIYEVEIGTKATSTIDNEPCFIIELSYACVVQLNNIEQNNKSFVILVEIPRMLFPFVRRIIADSVRDGGFPPLYIEPIDFLKLFEQNMQKN